MYAITKMVHTDKQLKIGKYVRYLPDASSRNSHVHHCKQHTEAADEYNKWHLIILNYM